MSNSQWRSVESINRMLGSGAMTGYMLTLVGMELVSQSHEKSFELAKKRSALFPIKNDKLEKMLSALSSGETLSFEKALKGFGKSIGLVIELDAIELDNPSNLERCLKVSEPIDDTTPDCGDDDSDRKVDLPTEDDAKNFDVPKVMTAHA